MLTFEESPGSWLPSTGQISKPGWFVFRLGPVDFIKTPYSFSRRCYSNPLHAPISCFLVYRLLFHENTLCVAHKVQCRKRLGRKRPIDSIQTPYLLLRRCHSEPLHARGYIYLAEFCNDHVAPLWKHCAAVVLDPSTRVCICIRIHVYMYIHIHIHIYIYIYVYTLLPLGSTARL